MKENTLFTFGCSYTQDFNDTTIKNYLDYFQYRGGSFPPAWPTILAEKLNLNVSNYGIGAAGNDLIFNEICKHINEIKKDDVVIIGWSYIHRYKWGVDGSDKWQNLGVGPLIQNLHISESTHEEIVLNRLNPLYLEEIYDRINLIDHISNVVGFSVYYWSSEPNFIYDKPYKLRDDKKFLLTDKILHHLDNHIFQIISNKGGKKINEETNGIVNDTHLGETGHQVQAELFYDHIINYKKQIPKII
jgi:hypothetical protein